MTGLLAGAASACLTAVLIGCVTADPTPSSPPRATPSLAMSTISVAPTASAHRPPLASPTRSLPPTAAPRSPLPVVPPPDGFPAQPEDVAWPTDKWVVARLPRSVDREAIDAATDRAFNDGGDQRVRAVVIVHGGAIVYERYSPNPDDGPDVVMPSFSVAKSVTSALIGILVRDGLLDILAPAPVPEWHHGPDDPRAAITVEHMLHMATGMEWDDGLSVGSDIVQMLFRNDRAAYAAAQQPSHEPGEFFDYNTGTSMLLARIVGDAAGGGRESTRAYLERELFDPIGMRPVHTDFDAAGNWAGGYSADSTARAFARFGLLYARGGFWDGHQVLPAEWVDYSRTPSPANPEYGAHWWLDPERPGVLQALGLNGQVITVDPAHDLVIVQLSTVGGEIPLRQTEAILDEFEGLP